MTHEDEIIESVDKVQKLIEELGEDRKENIKFVLTQCSPAYWTAPASSKEEYHYSHPGGLVKHSLNVFANLVTLNDAFNMNFNPESMLVVSLFHDLGKALNTDLKDYYEPQDEQWRKDKLGQNYKPKYGQVYLPNHQRSLFLLQKFEFPLNPEEFQAILLNDGQYLQENRGYGLKECPLALYLHIADRLALEQEKCQ